MECSDGCLEVGDIYLFIYVEDHMCVSKAVLNFNNMSDVLDLHRNSGKARDLTRIRPHIRRAL